MISVIVPARNEEKLLPQCLASLQNQDYKGDYEIIVVDNGSTDGTSKVAREFGARVIQCPKKGVVYARQAGADSASGDIIVQADADTTYLEDWLTRIAEFFSSHPHSAALAGSYVYRAAPPRWAKLEYFFRHLVNRFGQLFLHQASLISGANFAFRRQAFLTAEGYSEFSLYPDQWGIAHRLARIGKISYDGTLLVMTSSRRVQNPARIVFLQFLSNVAGIISYFVKHIFRLLCASFVRSPLARTRRRRAVSISLFVVVCLLAYGYLFPASQVFGKVYFKGSTSDRIVALTFDDGPNEPYTSAILDILDSRGIKATFFTVGKNVELYPEVARRIVSEGHVLGNHSYKHRANHALNRYGYKDIDVAQEVIFQVVGVSPHLYRPPHGKKSPWELYALKRDKLVEVNWNTSANDQHIIAYFGKPSPEILAREIVKGVKPGSIILMHDGHGTDHANAKSDKSLTVQALPLIIEQLEKQGYSFATAPELLKIPAYNQE